MKKILIPVLFMLLASHAVAAAPADGDMDGLSDWQEVNHYKTDPRQPDTDGDGFNDGMEVRNKFSPHDKKFGVRLHKEIRVDLKQQQLSYFVNGRLVNTFKVSTGKRSMPTPKGEYKVINKHPRAWSKRYRLWMPYWMGFKDGLYGLHELPEWPSGYKEGANHLGQAVSHGCIRLGVGPAKTLYDWADVGTVIKIN